MQTTEPGEFDEKCCGKDLARNRGTCDYITRLGNNSAHSGAQYNGTFWSRHCQRHTYSEVHEKKVACTFIDHQAVS
jgi:hypothetical protein